MEHLHYEFEAGPPQTVEVTLDKQANVRMLDDENYDNYRAGRSYSYVGGRATASPYRLRPPHPGHWHLVVDLGGASGEVLGEHRTTGYVPSFLDEFITQGLIEDGGYL